ncbi:hypothetical protein BASA81_008658 [Batrachochytrium salamandrivorans]|nr:hypothetical protein BASA81_008658 [Batrachochytrium salamandrivorans]
MDKSLLLEVSSKFLPLYSKVTSEGVRIVNERAARKLLLHRQELELVEEGLRRAKRLAKPQPVAPLSAPSYLQVLRGQWPLSTVSSSEAGEVDEDLLISQSATAVVQDSEDQDGDEEEEEEDTPFVFQQATPQKKSKKRQGGDVVANSVKSSARPDPFTTSAPLYSDAFGSRLVCRTCDYTLSRGARGVHLFSWHSNNHLAVNEEITDTMVFKPIEVATERNQSKWKIAKAACPCCGSNVGSMGYTESSVKVLLKGVSVAWRKPVDGKQLTSKPYHALEHRPQALIFPSTWLYSQAGLMTHTRRWVLDTCTLNKAVTDSKLMQMDEKWKTAMVDGNSILRAMDSEPRPVSEMMNILTARAMAIEAISAGFPYPTTADGLLEYTLSALEQISNRLDLLIEASSTEEEKEANQGQRQALETSLVLVRAACLAKLGVESLACDSDSLASLLLEETKNDLLNESESDAMALISARSLCALAKLYTADRTVLVQICKILQQRKQKFGDSAAAFGRSAEYLKKALTLASFPKADVDSMLHECTAMHPSPGARFGGQLDPSGFVELFCAHAECNKRATHASPDLPAVRRIPTYCRTHAPMSFVAPGALLLEREAAVANTSSTSSSSSSYAPSGGRFANNRRPNAIVNVPDPEATTFGPATPGTLFLGKRFQDSIEFVSTEQQLKLVSKFFDKHLQDAKAEMTQQDGTPSLQFAVGIDVEWKPEFLFHYDNNVASICQVSTRSKHFVFDMITLKDKLSPLFKDLYASKAVVKIGHGLSEDLSRIATHLASSELGGDNRHPQLKETAKLFFPCESILELTPLYCKSENKSYTGGAMPSLVAMVQAATGLKLDKSCQMTDWERRPLSPMQLRYASTDAACGLVLLDFFVDKVETDGSKVDLTSYLTTDLGTVQPQRGQTPPAVSTSFVMDATFGSRTLLRPAVVAAAEAAANASKPPPPTTTTPPLLLSTQKPHQHGTLQTTPTLSFLKRLQDLKSDLESQGVKVDEHASAASLSTATKHLERSLDRVVRDTLSD